ncbi:MAG: 6-hydroxynicotinate reductase, partial [Gammaproteobacteria bacterium]|nr:6-hydroxynicotinate reductase [Gammaproteobacteria bacterium]
MTREPKNLKNRTAEFGGKEDKDGIIRCDACPILCRIKPGKAGACARYANDDGILVRCDDLLLTQRVVAEQGRVVPFAETSDEWDGSLLRPADTFVTGVGAGTTYPDYKPAPFIVSARHNDVATVTVVTEGIFRYCG